MYNILYKYIRGQSLMSMTHSQETSVSWFGLVVRCEAGKQRDLSSNQLRLSFLLKSCGL